jgi:hypothetical protein
VKALSEAQRSMLNRVRHGHPVRKGEPYQVGNTNRTADALERMGLIAKAADQSKARRTLEWAWLLTPAGRGRLA